MRAFLVTMIFCLCFALPAHATSWASSDPAQTKNHQTRVHDAAATSRGDPRPRLWCGWFMRHLKGVADLRFNLAREWAHWGRNAGGPRVGAVVVWTYHVGEIVGAPDARGRWLVHSGNDGNAVRTRYLAVNRAIAFRE